MVKILEHMIKLSSKSSNTKNQKLSIEGLSKIRKLAFRRRVWFKVLSGLERGVVDLTIKYVDNVRSSKLAKVLVAIIAKLQHATKSMADTLTRSIGIPLALKISGFAVEWGCSSAKKWVSDLSFATSLAIMYTNK